MLDLIECNLLHVKMTSFYQMNTAKRENQIQPESMLSS